MSNSSSEWKWNWDVESSEAIARLRLTNETRVVTYDSPRSIANKVHYAMQKGLGGVMVWSTDTDDFNGDCSSELNDDRFSDFRTKPKVKLNFPKMTSKTYPLLRTLNDAIVLSLDEAAQEEQKKHEADDKENEISGSDKTKPSKTEPSAATTKVALTFSFVVLLASAPLTIL